MSLADSRGGAQGQVATLPFSQALGGGLTRRRLRIERGGNGVEDGYIFFEVGLDLEGSFRPVIYTRSGWGWSCGRDLGG